MTLPSFRDPSGYTWVGPKIVHRAAMIESLAPTTDQADLELLIGQFQAEGKWIPAKAVDPATLPAYLQGKGPLPKRAWEHPRIFFPSYAHEWSPAMLHSAAELTLELNERLLEVGWELKDASPTNVLFEGSRPIFVDHLSPSLRQPGQMGWTAYGQFIRTFIIPLCLHRLNGLPMSWVHLAGRDGIPPEVAFRQLRILDHLRPSVFGLITLPTLLSRHEGKKSAQGLRLWKDGDEGIGRQVTARLIRGLRRRLRNWAPRSAQETLWSHYDQDGESYTCEALREKEAFIQHALDTCKPKAVLDLGCNCGRYSSLAASANARVVAIDSDSDCVTRLFKRANAEALDIQPLLMDLGRPSPALGWENGEDAPFLARVEGRFDMLFALAIMHHLLVRERIPLERIISHLAEQTTRWAVIEWVPPDDPQFQRLAGPDQCLYSMLTIKTVEDRISAWFKIIAKQSLTEAGRTLYLLERRDSALIDWAL